MNKIYYFIMLVASVVGLCACDDDFGREYGIPEGESLLTMSVDFRDFSPALAGKSRGTQGDVIKSIDQLWVVVYKTDGTNVLTQKIEDFTENTVRPNERPDGVPSDETSTGHAEFKLRLYNDRYRIYAVANYDLSGMGNPSEEDLKNIKLDWQDDVKKNNAMFGFFTSSDAANPPVSFDAPEVVVRGTGTLHAWVRRAVSKLTIVYDGSGLKDGVFVYIKSARIKDMASDCLLGAPNDYNRIKAGYRLVDGDTIKYYPGDVEPADDASAYGPEYKYRVTCGGDVVGSHAEDANSLFFFENIQESGKEGTVTDKRQDTSGENKQVSWPGGRFENNEAWKDGRPYGTYVEVKGYYISIADGHMSSGPITYRFMLGKNVVDDYSAERNYHYKLTMMFKGYANDVDFHIDYTVLSPDGHVPPYYISYLYNHTAYHPVSVSTGKRRLTKVLCEIEENHWWPNDAQPKDAASGIVGVYNPAGVADPRSWQWHGFLSLRKTKDAVLTGNSNENTVTGSNARYYFDHLRHSREYSDMSEGWHVDDRRTVAPANTSVVPASYKEDAADRYFVKINYYKDKEIIDKSAVAKESDYDSIVYEIKVPLYTRAKQMIKSSGYSGNNPYTGFQRGARVKYTFFIEGLSEPLVRYADITQVRRVVNPKGIYRTENNNDPFFVELKVQIGEDSETFETLQSEGKWRARVLGNNPAIVTLNGSSDMIEGSTGSDIKFNVNFTGTHGAAVIRVEYHNYSCQHLIFVRKGSEPMQLIENGPKWHFSNLRTKDTECRLPQEEGSLFKYGNLDNPIDASSNQNDKKPWVNVRVSDFKDPRGKPLRMSTSDYSIPSVEKLWTEFWAEAKKSEAFDTKASGKPGVSGRIASFDDFNNMRESGDVGYGYGVLYGDGATKCADDIQDVYGYVWDNADSKNQGMRGVFIYNLDSTSTLYGNNIFLPIGNSGYGHRRTEGRSQGGDPGHGGASADYDDMNSTARFRNYAGMLKYAARNDYYGANVDKRPLFYDLWMRPGAIYWLNAPKDANIGDGKQTYLGWDLNYFTFDYYGFMASDLFYSAGNDANTLNSSACFVRMVDP